MKIEFRGKILIFILKITFYLNYSYIFFSLSGAPRIQPFSFPKNVTFGQTIKTFCSATGKEPLSFEWHKDGLPLYNSQQLKLQTHDDFSILSLTSVDYNSPGNYTCVVKNTLGSAFFSAELLIKGKIFFSIKIVMHVLKIWGWFKKFVGISKNFESTNYASMKFGNNNGKISASKKYHSQGCREGYMQVYAVYLLIFIQKLRILLFNP